MKESVKYDRETIDDCLTILVMADIRLFREQNLIDKTPKFNFMVICRLLKSSNSKTNELLSDYEQIISEFSLEQSDNEVTAELEFLAVLRVIRLINPKWKISP